MTQIAPIRYIDRETGLLCEESVYGRTALKLLYGDSPLTRWLSLPILQALTRYRWFSQIYGWIQKQSWTRNKVQPFIEQFEVDASEFETPPGEFTSFNDFFIRRLKAEARPLPSDPTCAVLPADARYLAKQQIGNQDLFTIKGLEFSLSTFFKDQALADQFTGGSLLIARLCPSDYHRFHFPVSGIATTPIELTGVLRSVNPWALGKYPSTLQENHRVLTLIESELFGTVAMVEIGATCVGSIHQTFSPNQHYAIGKEKGFFSFGGSAIALFFKKGSIQIDRDLLDATEQGLEILGKMGQRLGVPQ